MMQESASKPVLRDELELRWGFLEDQPDACIVVSERMEFVYMNARAHELAPGEWFGKRCFEVLPLVDETCAFHCDKMRAVADSADVVYCEESVAAPTGGYLVLGVGLIPLGDANEGPGRAVLLLRQKRVPVLKTRDDVADESAFRTSMLEAARQLRDRIGQMHPAADKHRPH